MLTTQRHTGSAMPCNNNIVDEAGERRDAADEKGDNGTPITSKFWRIAVDTVEVIHVGHGNSATPDDVVIGNQYGCHRAQEDGVASEESKKLRGGCKNLPRNESPRPNNSSK